MEEEKREFLEGKFYISNLINKFKIENEAINNLIERGFTLEELQNIKNYDEIGIVEYVAKGEYTVENDEIIPD